MDDFADGLPSNPKERGILLVDPTSARTITEELRGGLDLWRQGVRPEAEGALSRALKRLQRQERHGTIASQNRRPRHLGLSLPCWRLQRGEHFSNGRLVRNTFKRTLLRMANRLAADSDVSFQELTTIEVADIPEADELESD